MSNDNAINLEEFEGLKCSRLTCGAPADIVEDADGEVYVLCQHCLNSQTVHAAPEPEEDTTLHDAVHDYLTALDSPRYAASHQQSVEKNLAALRQVFLDAS